MGHSGLQVSMWIGLWVRLVMAKTVRNADMVVVTALEPKLVTDSATPESTDKWTV